MSNLLKEWEEEQAIKTEMQEITSQHRKLYPPKIPQDLASPITGPMRAPPKTIGPGLPFLNPAESPTIQAGRDVDRRMVEAQSPMEAFKIAQEHPMMGFGTADLAPMGLAGVVKAWHGSGAPRFEKFSNDYIGTGEGAQAFGYGLYFAGKKEVAEHYRNKLADVKIPTLFGGKTFDPTILASFYSRDALKKYNYDLEKVIPSLEKLVGNIKDETSASILNDIKIFKNIKKKGGFTNTGKLYKVELAPDDDEFLLWDKPLSEQSEKVQKALKNIGYQPKSLGEQGALNPKETGQEVYMDLAEQLATLKFIEDKGWTQFINTINDRVVDMKKASETLLKAGIKGIKYLEGASRKKGEGEYNYVIFDPEHIKIEDVE